MKRRVTARACRGAVIAGLLAFVGSPGTGHAQPAAAPTPAPPATAPAPMTGRVTIDADDTSVASVLRLLASRSGLNIVMAPGIQDRTISLHLRDTPVDEAMTLVLRAAGLAVDHIGGSILVAEGSAPVVPVGSIARVFDLQYASAEDVKAMLAVLTSDVSADPGRQQVSIRGDRVIIDEAAAMIQQLDRRPMQVQLSARLIEVNVSDLSDLGIDWENITRWKTVVTEGNPGSTAPGTLPRELPYDSWQDHAGWNRQAAAFEIAIDMLLNKGKARLLSDANVVTMDGRAAEIFAGETVPVVITSLQSSGQSGAVQSVQLEKVDVGVKLKILPRITGEGYITTAVEPEVSRIIRFVGPNSDLPQTSTRRARTLVRVHDGEKIYLGGLLNDERRTTVKMVPGLGQIPLLGHLFRWSHEEIARLDLVIEITPRIVGDEGAALPRAPRSSLSPDAPDAPESGTPQQEGQ